MLLCSTLCDAERSTKHSSQPQPSESVRVGQSGDFRIPLGSLIHNGFLQHWTVQTLASVLAAVVFSQKWLNIDKEEPPHARPSEDPTTPRASAPGKAFTILETAARDAWQAGTRHLTPARLAFAPRLPLSGYPPPVLGLMLATTEIACILACGSLGWGLGMRPRCRSPQHSADDSTPWPSS